MPSRKRTRKVIATRESSNHVDITDPCYSKTAIHRLNNIEIEPGKYECDMWIKEEDEIEDNINWLIEQFKRYQKEYIKE